MANLFEVPWRRRFEALIRPHLRELYTYAYRLCGNRERAEDVVQDLVTRLYQTRARLDEVEKLRPWLYKSLFRQYLNSRRSESRSPFGYLEADEAALDGLEDVHNTPETLTERHLQRVQLNRALYSLSPEFRDVLVMHDIEGFGVAEVAEILDIPVGTVKSRIHRARHNLRRQLSAGTPTGDSVFGEIEG